MEQVKKAPYGEVDRMRLRGLIRLASEIISHYWPMRTFVHHNPLHGLEQLHFEEAVRIGRQLMGGMGYLSCETYREYYRSGRIRSEHLDAALTPHALDRHLAIGTRKVAHFEVLRAVLVHGIGAIREFGMMSDAAIESSIYRSKDRALLEAVADHVGPVLKTPSIREQMETDLRDDLESLGKQLTPTAWCDRTSGVGITERINGEMIKWCEAFLDEDHSAWSMPGRERGFYLIWKDLAAHEWSPCGISDSRQKLARVPEHPEDALLEHLDLLGIPEEVRQDYLSLHLTALPGWAGFIKWRADQTEYEWQRAYPIDLAQYLAVRLWYVRELVGQACREELGIEGNVGAMSNYMRTQPQSYFLRKERVAGRLPSAYAAEVDRLRFGRPARRNDGWGTLAEQYAAECDPRRDRNARLDAARRLLSLSQALEIDPSALTETPPENLKLLIDWIDAFPESEREPVWLKAFEDGFQERLLDKLMPNVAAHETAVEDYQKEIRPQAQAVFCIDVRSEPFRRHLEAVGDYETYGFAGFFTVFIRYRGLGSHHETDQFPVIMKAKNTVREIPRTYQGQLLSRSRAGAKLIHTGHTLLHDLKENVITPYVMVESVGWFYGIPFIGKTVFTSWYRKWTAWLRRRFAPPIATTLTVDKLTREEVEEMLAAEQRSVIRRALQERFGDRDLNLSLERLEALRRRALDVNGSGQPPPTTPSRPNALSAEEEAHFIEELRSRYRIDAHWAFARMERITQTGFTPAEQLFTVETALRLMGLTRNFARLVLFCAHGGSSDNNPFESALDCGACGGHPGKPNARVLAAMANKPNVREALAKNGIAVPQDTYFIAGQHDTATDEVEFFDLEDLPPTHRKDLLRLIDDLKEAGSRNRRERCARFPEIGTVLSPARATREARRRSGDWSQLRPEWGLSGNAVFIVGRRDLIRGVDLEGRAFLQSYDYREDPTGRFLEILMTGPQVVGQWINMEHYFSTVDNEVYGSGSKVYHNVVGRFGIMSGPWSDLRLGLAQPSVLDGTRPYHEPMRLLSLIEAPRERIDRIIRRHRLLQHYYDNEWVRLTALDPEEKTFYDYIPKRGWVPHENKLQATGFGSRVEDLQANSPGT
ncbi:MAG TPA: DUF2309 domain-containing protein [Nitrospiria bacterium]|nr:DUF2309 domain-containing protein [Nitrospiria bacterium]